MPGPFPTRTGGVLLHPTSLAGHDLIGTLGAEAYAFIDWLASAGAGVWQILPLSINGKFDSPYFAASAFAGNIWLVDLEELVTAGLLDRRLADLELHEHEIDARVQFELLRRRKRPLLWAAAATLIDSPDHPWRAAYDGYAATTEWLTETCTYFAIRESLDQPWWEWPEPLRRAEPAAIAAEQTRLAEEIERWQVVLYFFDRQWAAVRAAAHAAGITIVGDLPIYVADDSADVWAHQDQFALDDDGRMIVQSGAPPDYFSELGQLWKNPLYRWDVMADDRYAWWRRRLRRCLELTDVVRIDHFRALSAYWEVAADATDARGGRWVEGPGQDFLDAVRAEFSDFPLIAEDLGTLDDAVHRLRDDNGLPGMRIVQFGFDGLPDNPHRPDAITDASIVYTGTHDNEPIAAWWAGLPDDTRAAVAHAYQHEFDASPGRATWSFIEAAIASPAIAAVIPMQDLLVLDARSRMNNPAVELGNWGWRMPADALSDSLAASLRALLTRYGRA